MRARTGQDGGFRGGAENFIGVKVNNNNWLFFGVLRTQDKTRTGDVE